MLSLFTLVMEGLQVYPENMKRNIELTQQLVFSQRVLIALIEKGMKRQDAYRIVQRNAMKAWNEKTSFSGLLKADAAVTGKIPENELTALFDYNYFLKHVDDIFQRLGLLKTKGTPPSRTGKRTTKKSGK